MALIKCKDCGSEMSDQAKRCPKCGRSRATKADMILCAVIGVLIAIGGVSLFFIFL